MAQDDVLRSIPWTVTDESQPSHDSMEYRLQLELWRGNVAGAVQIARETNEISDWIVAMAPLASYDLWELVSAEYAEKLEEEGHYHKAVTYLLAGNKVHQAIDLFRRHRLFKEAVSLTRLRLSPVDPVLEDLYTEWGQNLMKDGQFEQAAHCYLAMRHIQEAEKVNTRHRQQLILETPTYTTLAANENQRGLACAYTIVSQHLVMGQWQEAYRFTQEHESLKVLLSLLITHQLLVQQLTNLSPGLTLTNRAVTPDMFPVLENNDIPKDMSGFPEFLVDKSEIDPVVPWEPFLIGEHTFPHHLLRVWHRHLNVTMATQELKAMHASLSQLVSRKQKTYELASTLVLVSLDLTLCLLTLLMSETSSAISHFLQAMSTLHKGNHKLVLQAICRLMLPQGPKYLLKLQQEFTACRVLITMESHGDVNTAWVENHNSIKKFLTDIKNDSAISMPSLRCRELDCLRAYYYLAILDFLSASLICTQHDNDSHDGMPNRKVVMGDQDNVEDCDGQKISTDGNACTSKIMKKTERDIINSDQDLINCETSNVSKKTTQCDIQVTDCERNTKSGFHQNSTTLLPASCSTLAQHLIQSQAGDSDAILVVHGSRNKESNGSLTIDDGPNINKTLKGQFNKRIDNSFAYCCNGPNISLTSDVFNKASLQLSNEVKPKSTSSSSGQHVALPMLGKASLESSPVDPLVVPSKLSMLKMSPLRSAADGSNTIIAQSSISSSSSLSWPSYSPLFLSPSNSPLTLSPLNSPTILSPSFKFPFTIYPSSKSPSIKSSPSNSKSHISWPTLSLSPTSNSPSSISPSSNLPLSSPTRNQSSEKVQQHINQSNKISSDVKKTTSSPHPKSSKGHLNYANLLRLSKGILWDTQAKQEALTVTLGYIHHAISQHLLNKFSKSNSPVDPGFRDTQKQSVKNKHSNSSLAVSNALEEDGGFNNTLLTSPSTIPEADTSTGILREKASTTTCEGSRTMIISSSNSESVRLPFLHPVIQKEDVLQQCPVDSFTESYLTYKVPSCQSSRQESSIAIQLEQEPAVFRKSRKVLWMDGEGTSTNVSADSNMSAYQILRHTPDGSAIPVEWDDLPVDVKYSLPCVTLSLLKKEQATISQELKRMPDMSEIPFPSIGDSIRRLLHTSLMSPHISAQEKRFYFKQLNDWATLFSVTTSQQRETEAMFSEAAEEHLAKR